MSSMREIAPEMQLLTIKLSGYGNWIAKLCLAVWIAIACAPPKAIAEEPRLSAKQKAIARIPFERMTTSATARVRETIDSGSVFKHLPESTIKFSQELYIQLIRYP